MQKIVTVKMLGWSWRSRVCANVRVTQSHGSVDHRKILECLSRNCILIQFFWHQAATQRLTGSLEWYNHANRRWLVDIITHAHCDALTSTSSCNRKTSNHVQGWCKLYRWLIIVCSLAVRTGRCVSGRWRAWDRLRPVNHPAKKLLMLKTLLGNNATTPSSRWQQTSSLR